MSDCFSHRNSTGEKTPDTAAVDPSRTAGPRSALNYHSWLARMPISGNRRFGSFLGFSALTDGELPAIVPPRVATEEAMSERRTPI